MRNFSSKIELDKGVILAAAYRRKKWICLVLSLIIVVVVAVVVKVDILFLSVFGLLMLLLLLILPILPVVLSMCALLLDCGSSLSVDGD